MKRVSIDPKYEFIFDFKTGEYRDERDNEASNKISYSNTRVNAGEYVTCSCDGQIWVSVVITINDAEKDALIRFIHPHLPKHVLFWPTRNDECNVPFNRTMMEVNTFSTMSSSGRNYAIHSTNVKKLELLY